MNSNDYLNGGSDDERKDPELPILHDTSASGHHGGGDKHVRLAEPEEDDENGDPDRSSRIERPKTARHASRTEEEDLSGEELYNEFGEEDSALDARTQQNRLWEEQTLRGRERTYDVNLVTTNMPLYEPLLDEYLADYFNSPKIRSHLLKLGLVDGTGRIIDPKRFKYNQIRLDRSEYRSRILKHMDDLDFDREVEVSIRKQIEEDKSPRSQKLRKTMQQAATSMLPYPEFLAQYPVTMTRTALLYAEKPASLAKAEELLLRKQRYETPRKLKALGLTQEQLAGKHRTPDKVRGNSATRPTTAGRGSVTARPGTVKPNANRSRKGAQLIVHDDLSGDEWEGQMGHTVTTARQARKDQVKGRPKLHEGDSIADLFDTAKQKYQSGNIDDAEVQVRKILQRVGRPAPKQAEASAAPRGLFEDAASQPTTAANTRPTSAAFAKLKSGRSTPSTPRHRSFRPKSARPTRESHFPMTSDFSDFDAGSEGGFESDGEVFMLDDADSQKLAAGIVETSGPIEEEQEAAIIKEVVEQTQLEPTAAERTQSLADLASAKESATHSDPSEQRRQDTENDVSFTSQAQDIDDEPDVDQVVQAVQGAQGQPDYDADFESPASHATTDPAADVVTFREDGDDHDTEQEANDMARQPHEVQDRPTPSRADSNVKFWTVDRVDAAVEASQLSRTANNSSFDVHSEKPHRSNNLLMAAIAGSVRTLADKPTEDAAATGLQDGDEIAEESDYVDQKDSLQHVISAEPNPRGGPLRLDSVDMAAQLPVPPSSADDQARKSPRGSSSRLAAKAAKSSPLSRSATSSEEQLNAPRPTTAGHVKAASRFNLGSASPKRSQSGIDLATKTPLPPSVVGSVQSLAEKRGSQPVLSRSAMRSVPLLATNTASAASSVDNVVKPMPSHRSTVKMAASVPLPESAAPNTNDIAKAGHFSAKSTASTDNLVASKQYTKSVPSLASRTLLGSNGTRGSAPRIESSVGMAAALPLPPSAATSLANVNRPDASLSKASARSASSLISSNLNSRGSRGSDAIINGTHESDQPAYIAKPSSRHVSRPVSRSGSVTKLAADTVARNSSQKLAQSEDLVEV
ncbi:hypothetical protein HKX48_004459 [Thoreauomyces humboldtii]|nr:hypothetical protein HKX48_004459 [Thoreauomyces humboldtii]